MIKFYKSYEILLWFKLSISSKSVVLTMQPLGFFHAAPQIGHVIKKYIKIYTDIYFLKNVFFKDDKSF